MAAVFASDAGKSVVKIAAIQITVNHLFDIGPPEAVLFGELFIIGLNEGYGDGKAVLEVYNSSTDHSAGNLVGSVTFDSITDATNLDSLLGKVDIDHDA